jgi:hypothetical protein
MIGIQKGAGHAMCQIGRTHDVFDRECAGQVLEGDSRSPSRSISTASVPASVDAKSMCGRAGHEVAAEFEIDPQVLYEMEPISQLARLRRTLANSLRVEPASISAHDLDRRVPLQPLRRTRHVPVAFAQIRPGAQDGSRHAWLAAQPMLDLIVTMDDAASTIYSAFLVEEEGTASSFHGLLETFAAAMACRRASTDRGSHYFQSKAGEKVDKQRPTQVGRALQRLGSGL